jgi:hypothetical protein
VATNRVRVRPTTLLALRCRGRNYGTLSLFTTQWMRTHCHSWLPVKWRMAGTKTAVTTVRHHKEVAVACCLAPTDTCNLAALARVESIAGMKRSREGARSIKPQSHRLERSTKRFSTIGSVLRSSPPYSAHTPHHLQAPAEWQRRRT